MRALVVWELFWEEGMRAFCMEAKINNGALRKNGDDVL
jgi:hypothetical protein